MQRIFLEHFLFMSKSLSRRFQSLRTFILKITEKSFRNLRKLSSNLFKIDFILY
jgi:uncharacterized protein YggT (Ycf19 family)